MTYFLKNNIEFLDFFYINIYKTKNDFVVNNNKYLLR